MMREYPNQFSKKFIYSIINHELRKVLENAIINKILFNCKNNYIT